MYSAYRTAHHITAHKTAQCTLYIYALVALASANQYSSTQRSLYCYSTVPAPAHSRVFFLFHMKWNGTHSFIWLCIMANFTGKPHDLSTLEMQMQIYMLDCCLLWIRGFEFCVRVDATMPFWLCCIAFCENGTWAIRMCNDICLCDVRCAMCGVRCAIYQIWTCISITFNTKHSHNMHHSRIQTNTHIAHAVALILIYLTFPEASERKNN